MPGPGFIGGKPWFKGGEPVFGSGNGCGDAFDCAGVFTEISAAVEVLAGGDYDPKCYIFSAVVELPQDCDFVSIFWEFGDGTTSGSLSPRHCYPDTEVYTATATLTIECGGIEYTCERSITVGGTDRLCFPDSMIPASVEITLNTNGPYREPIGNPLRCIDPAEEAAACEAMAGTYSGDYFNTAGSAGDISHSYTTPQDQAKFICDQTFGGPASYVANIRLVCADRIPLGKVTFCEIRGGLRTNSFALNLIWTSGFYPPDTDWRGKTVPLTLFTSENDRNCDGDATATFSNG